ncbi:MAG: aminoacyl-tRNA hydrolase [Clostridiales bacterium]|jgi:PTH1 family peptidyl-tRNA hydrolase|nr:aminoacyl-tRNA hydrolase [Clostridiales bacterium]
MEVKTKVIVGLGNYGDEYAYTYHNMGFMVVECLAERYRLDFKQKPKLHARLAQFVTENGDKIILAQPWTYMNLSGICVAELLSFYKINLSDLIVIFDDIDIEKGCVRVRQRGSGGTHNGMRNIVSVLKNQDFARVRIGIGKPPEGIQLGDWVVMNVSASDRPLIAKTIECAADCVQDWLNS